MAISTPADRLGVPFVFEAYRSGGSSWGGGGRGADRRTRWRLIAIDDPSDDFDRDYDDFGEDVQLCHTCHGDGWGIVGTDWDSDDAINGPYDGEIETCPNCHGSGLAKDCSYW